MIKQNIEEDINKRRNTQTKNVDIDLTTQDSDVVEIDMKQKRPILMI